MKVIWKFTLEVNGEQRVTMPIGARLLTVQVQNDVPCLWAIVDTSNIKPEDHIIKMYGTGHEHKEIDGTYLGTFQMMVGSALVFHVFEMNV
jgi:hypothetical protein